MICRNPGESYVTPCLRIVYRESHSSASNILSSTYRKGTWFSLSRRMTELTITYPDNGILYSCLKKKEKLKGEVVRGRGTISSQLPDPLRGNTLEPPCPTLMALVPLAALSPTTMDNNLEQWAEISFSFKFLPSGILLQQRERWLTWELGGTGGVVLLLRWHCPFDSETFRMGSQKAVEEFRALSYGGSKKVLSRD